MPLKSLNIQIIFIKGAFLCFGFFFNSLELYGAEKKTPLLLISVDGMRPDSITEANTPNLWKFSNEGVRAKSLKPIFPSHTFPNHYTIVTGLYADEHGITANEIYDSTRKQIFSPRAPKAIRNDPFWWIGEPLWVTAQKQGLRSGILFWPGSESAIQGILPTHYLPFDPKVSNKRRVSKLLQWFDLPIAKRPQFFILYFDLVDATAHKFGPNSKEELEALRSVDQTIGELFVQLNKRKIEKNMNILVVSDHGMAATDEKKAINISDVLKKYPKVVFTGGGPIVGFFSSDEKEIDTLKKELEKKSQLYTLYKKSEIPASFHYQKSIRVPDLLLVAIEGGAVATKPSFINEGPARRGSHGYDNALPSMQASFLAKGPAFRSNFVSEAFENIHIYSLMCHLLGITASPNEGSLERTKDLLKSGD